MPTELIVDNVVRGLLIGMVYGLSALGLSVIFGVIRVVNFAHGELMVWGMFVSLTGFRLLGLDPLWMIPLVAVVLFVVGYVMQAAMINRLIAAPEHMQFLLLASVALILVNLAQIVFGPDAQNVIVDYAFDSFVVGPLILDKTRVYAAGAALIVCLLLYVFFRFTRTGKAIRACADNRLGAQVVGLDVKRLYALTFGIGAACIGAAGSIMLLLIDVHPHLAVEYTLLAFIIVIIGGLGSMAGALVGGILIGVSEQLAGLFIQPSLKSVVSFGLLILVLLLWPQGLFGKRPS